MQSNRTPEVQLQGTMMALHYTMAQVERTAALAVWNAPDESRNDVAACIMGKLAHFLAEVQACVQRPEGGGGSGPNCRPGFHEEFGICVPDYEV